MPISLDNIISLTPTIICIHGQRKKNNIEVQGCLIYHDDESFVVFIQFVEDVCVCVRESDPKCEYFDVCVCVMSIQNLLCGEWWWSDLIKKSCTRVVLCTLLLLTLSVCTK
mmetsp:Transcript_35074/g.53025  ORF Transcript_35074/g.53025 Transcript_35074/m.53025 type:complete len:111 (-) Transcript_35074:29-361(-)